MAFWLWAVLSVVAVMGVLLIAPTAIDGTLLYAGYWGGIFGGLSLIFGLFGLWVARPNWLFVGIKPMVVTLFLGLSIFFFGIRTYQHHAHYTHTASDVINAPTPLVVTAKVQIFELSDSIYNPALGLPYRQKAVLTDIRPYSPKTVATTTMDNPFGFEGQITSSQAQLPQTLTVLLNAYPHRPTKAKSSDPLADLAKLGVGDELTMSVRLSPIVPDEQAGFDSYKWLLTRHIHAKADIIALESTPVAMTNLAMMDKFRLKIEQFRHYYHQIFYDKFKNDLNASTAVALSLLTGDRALIDKPTKELYQYGGISHLLAISGTHILLLAIVLANVATFLANRVPSVYYRIPKWQLRFAIMAFVAVLYAIFTGFEVPAVRTVFMLICVGLVRWLLLRVSAFVSLAVVGLVMIALDPYVVWQAGFWLSFVAVGLLMAYENHNQNKELSYQPIELLKLQAYIFVAMLPISLLLFGKVSVLGLAVNLVAVGLFGYVIVPLGLLGGVLYLLLPSVAEGIWSLAVAVLDGVHSTLAVLALTQGTSWLYTPMPVALVLVFGLGFWVWRTQFLPKLFVLLPAFVAVCVIAFPKGASVANALYELPLSAPAVRAVLVANGDASWLILSAKTTKGQSLNDEKLANELIQAIQKLGVKRLAGVLIQDETMAAARMAGRMSLEMPVYRLLWAGDELSIGKLTAQKCQADNEIALPNGKLRILTGWRDIAERSMHTCNVAVMSDTPMTLMSDGEPSQATSVLINASDDELIWQVYHLLCASQGEQAFLPTVILSRRPLSAELMQKFGKGGLD